MNENQNDNPIAPGTDNTPGFFKSIAIDDGFQRACAGLLISAVVAASKYALFGGSK